MGEITHVKIKALSNTSCGAVKERDFTFPVDTPYEDIENALKNSGFVGCRCIETCDEEGGMAEEWVCYGGAAGVVSFDDIFDEMDLIKTYNANPLRGRI